MQCARLNGPRDVRTPTLPSSDVLLQEALCGGVEDMRERHSGTPHSAGSECAGVPYGATTSDHILRADAKRALERPICQTWRGRAAVIGTSLTAAGADVFR